MDEEASTSGPAAVALPAIQIQVTGGFDRSLQRHHNHYEDTPPEQPLILNNNNNNSSNGHHLMPVDNRTERSRQPSSQVSAASSRQPVGWRPIIPDGGWGWVVVLGSFLIHVFADGFVYSFGILIVELLAEFNEGRAWTSWIVSTLVGLTLGCGPLASAITNRYGCRLTTMVGAVVASIGCAISMGATSVFYLLISVGFIMGTGFGLMYCPAIVIVTMYFEEKRAFATGIAVCGAGFGTMIFAPLSNYLIQEYTWRGAFLIYSGIILNCAVCGALFRPLEFEPIYEEDLMLGDIADAEPSTEKTSPDADDQAADFMLSHDSTAPSSQASPQKSLRSAEKEPAPFLLESGNAVGYEHERLQLGNGVCIQLETIESVASMTGKAFSAFDVNPTANVGATEQNGLTQPQLPRATSMMVSNNDDNQTQRRPTYKSRTSTTMSGSRRRGISESSGYLDVKDVFYPGSVRHLAAFNDQPDAYRAIQSVHDRSATMTSRKSTTAGEHKRTIDSDVAIVSEPSTDTMDDFKHVLYKMANVSLLRDTVFVLFVVSNFLTSVGLNPPLIFLPDLGDELDIDRSISSLFISTFGIANTIGRVVFGYIADRPLPCRWGRNPAKNRLAIYNTLITLCGLATCLSIFADNAVTVMIYSAVFGLSLSAYVCLTSVLLVDLLGLDKLTNAFGLLLLFQGIASLIGAPIAGWMVDTWGSYDWSFLFAGVCILLSGLMLYAIPWIKPDFGENQINAAGYVH